MADLNGGHDAVHLLNIKSRAGRLAPIKAFDAHQLGNVTVPVWYDSIAELPVVSGEGTQYALQWAGLTER